MDVRDRGDLPPGQVGTRKWPVLHSGNVPRLDTATWTLRVFGAVRNPLTLTWAAFTALPRRTVQCDLHCVTHWTRRDNEFHGVAVEDLLRRAGVTSDATAAMIHAAPDYTTNLPLADLDRPANLIATHVGGEPLPPEHGGPARLLVPHLYLWKSAKWITGIEILEEDEPGFWEQNGYHMRGDPRGEERYGRAEPVRMRRGPRT